MPDDAKAGRKPEGAAEPRAKVEAFVARQSAAQRKIINRLRAVVKAAVPSLEERMRWLQVGYLVSNRDVCGIYPSSNHVNLSFAKGSTLKDPEGLLEGTGKGIRHIKVFTVEQVGEERIKTYVREAVASLQRS